MNIFNKTNNTKVNNNTVVQNVVTNSIAERQAKITTYLSIGILIVTLIGLLFLFGFRIRKCSNNIKMISKDEEEE